MKILRFNEDSDNKKLDIEHLNNCFIDFIDRGNSGFKRAGHDSFSIEIDLNRKRKSKSIEIDKIISEIDLIKSQLLEIKDSIEKVKIEYPDIDVELIGGNGYTKYIVNIDGGIEPIIYNGQKQIVDLPFPKQWNVNKNI